MKYTIIKNNPLIMGGKKLYRIKALKSFSDVKKGDLGGWVESKCNLSQDGLCWIYDEAIVCGNAIVRGNAKVYGKAEIRDDANIAGDAEVSDNAKICGNAIIYGKARVYGNAYVSGYASVRDRAVVYGDAQIVDHAHIYEEAHICDNACIYGQASIAGSVRIHENAEICDGVSVTEYAHVYGDAKLWGNVNVCGCARVYGRAYLSYGIVDYDVFDRRNLVKYIMSSLKTYPVNGKYVLYKRVNKIDGIFRSIHDPSFIYEIGSIIEVKDYDPDIMNSCSRGIHVSTLDYWDAGNATIQVEVDIDDVITCQEGKLRVKKVKVLGEVLGLG